MQTAVRWATALVFVAVVSAARSEAQDSEAARGSFINLEGKEIGTVTVNHMTGATIFIFKVKDLPPGEHGMHIHDVGVCKPPFDSAGPHLNPGGKQHGSKNPKGPHAGDLPNLKVGADGKAEFTVTVDTEMQLSGEASLLAGDAVSIVIHAAPDDFTTDPSGNSGARIACAVLEMSNRQD
ncbi:MAG: superoxide dismutase family protein [Candidatus Binatia bacterium]